MPNPQEIKGLAPCVKEPTAFGRNEASNNVEKLFLRKPSDRRSTRAREGRWRSTTRSKERATRAAASRSWRSRTAEETVPRRRASSVRPGSRRFGGDPPGRAPPDHRRSGAVFRAPEQL
jgi:hypothetical protein